MTTALFLFTAFGACIVGKICGIGGGVIIKPVAETAGGVQASLLMTAIFLTLLYTINQNRIATKKTWNPAMCTAIGLALGMLGAFLGIGGGPFNMVVLYYFFSM